MYNFPLAIESEITILFLHLQVHVGEVPSKICSRIQAKPLKVSRGLDKDYKRGSFGQFEKGLCSKRVQLKCDICLNLVLYSI